MTTLGNVAFRSLVTVAVVGLPIAACQGPEAFYRDSFEQGSGGSLLGAGGSGAGGVFGLGGTTGNGGATGTGGRVAGLGGATGTGGAIGSGGTTGTGGKGGASGTGGVIGSGGASGTGGASGLGGTGDSTGTEGLTGSGGVPGTGGVTGSGGASGSGGVTGAGGAGGITGAGGSGSTGTGPCAGFCDEPTVLTTQAASGNNMTPGACYSTTASIQGAECTGATGFMVDGVVVKCTGAAIPLPAKIMGGYCFQFATTDPSFAGFSTY